VGKEEFMQMAINSVRKLSVAEAAAFLGVSKSWLDKKRLEGGGPAYLKLGRRVVYDLNDLEDFAVSKRLRSTSDHEPKLHVVAAIEARGRTLQRS
jgi:predicted DNA-binding transcriptional regulator AlpA